MSIVRLKETNSTNSYAKEHIDELQDKAVIIADRQISGRGRFNRVWVDLGDDNLFMSIVLKPQGVAHDIYPNLTQYMSVVICEVMEEYGLTPQIKWPNDVLINGKKICGILSETVTKGSNLKGIVLGVGVNLNSNYEKVAEIKDKDVTALNMELSVEHTDKEEFTEKLISKFFRFYDDFLHIGFPMIKNNYIGRTFFLNNTLSVKVFDDLKSGTAKRITDSGELVLENDGKELVLTMGDIL